MADDLQRADLNLWSEWIVRLAGGGEARVWAMGFGREAEGREVTSDDEHLADTFVFEVLVGGSPPERQTIARFPAHAVVEIVSAPWDGADLSG
jgi:hypothetical protein